MYNIHRIWWLWLLSYFKNCAFTTIFHYKKYKTQHYFIWKKWSHSHFITFFRTVIDHKEERWWESEWFHWMSLQRLPISGENSQRYWIYSHRNRGSGQYCSGVGKNIEACYRYSWKRNIISLRKGLYKILANYPITALINSVRDSWKFSFMIFCFMYQLNILMIII